ncbi:MAG: H-NS histone family protein, partial [Anaerolineales bacterium]|nr:H-NS histone family protein [Anaerolineales bacterium]
MAEFDLTAEDLGFKLVRKTAKAKSASTPKYRDPQTGKTWTGRGKPPAWMTRRLRKYRALWAGQPPKSKWHRRWNLSPMTLC